LCFVVRRDQDDGPRNFKHERVAKIGLGYFDGVTGREGAEGLGEFIRDAMHVIEDQYPVVKRDPAEVAIARGEPVDGCGGRIDEGAECASED
jgi:hypothetical protein